MIAKYAFMLTTDAELPLIVELWNYFLEVYIYNDVSYENISFGGLFSPQTLIIGIFLGLAAACFVAVFSKKANGALVHKLIDEGCTTPETAKTLPELDLADKLLLRFGVKRGALIRSVVVCKEEEEYLLSRDQAVGAYAPVAKNTSEDSREEAEEVAEEVTTVEPKKEKKKKNASVEFPVNPDIHHFYIPEKNMIAALTKFRKKGFSWGAVVYFENF